MTMEVWQGQAKEMTNLDEAGAAECVLDQGKVNLHRDLARDVTAGDEIIVVGELVAGVLNAYALKNRNSKKIRQIDSSNYILIIGFGFFIAMLCMVLGGQYYIAGNNLLASVNAVISLAGTAVALWGIVRAFRINTAGKRVKYEH